MSDLAAMKARIRAELRADGATQADLARHLGVSEKHVSAVLTGKQAGSPAFLEAMAHAVGLRLTVGWGDV
jgi:transcriptional regulator with XRE-family HTH domain